jgi:hypothetical protein
MASMQQRAERLPNTVETRQSGEIANTSAVLASPCSDDNHHENMNASIERPSVLRAELPTVEQDYRRIGSRREQLRAHDLLISNDYDVNPARQMHWLHQQTRTSRQF